MACDEEVRTGLPDMVAFERRAGELQGVGARAKPPGELRSVLEGSRKLLWLELSESGVTGSRSKERG